MTREIAEETVLITGGGRGIGAATAKIFCEKGARVMIMSRSESELREVIESCSEAGVRSGFSEASVDLFIGDISDSQARIDVFEKIEKKWGGVTTLVNNAATISVEDLDKVSHESWQRTINVNVSSAFFLSQLAFAAMKKNQVRGSIINLSSLGGISGTDKFPGFTAYTVSKFAVVGLTEALASEGREAGIRVNCIAPGAVDTKMLKDAAPFLKTDTKPEDIAKIILFLADSSQSASITGTTIPVYSNLPD